MSSHLIVDSLTYLEPLACLLALGIIQFRRQVRTYLPLVLFLATRVASFVILMALLRFKSSSILNPHTMYKVYFYTYWATYAIEAVLGFFIIVSIYRLAMAPLHGLQRLGMLMFRWAGGIATAIAVTMAFGPHVTSTTFIIRFITQLQQIQSVLTLCMLLFVCLAIRPMGLSYSSKIFGVSLGLGISAAAELIGAAWLAHFSTTVYSLLSILNGTAICMTVLTWAGYFAAPEPKRRMIVLPTTSPFLRWNQISMALGDDPGFVALGPVTPEMFAPAEVEVMRRATAKMRLPVAN